MKFVVPKPQETLLYGTRKGWNTVFSQCPNFSTESKNDLNYYISKNHSTPKPDAAFKC